MTLSRGARWSCSTSRVGMVEPDHRCSAGPCRPALFAGQTWARVIAVALAILSAVGQLLPIAAQPWWSLIVIAIDVLIIYALERDRGRSSRRESSSQLRTERAGSIRRRGSRARSSPRRRATSHRGGSASLAQERASFCASAPASASVRGMAGSRSSSSPKTCSIRATSAVQPVWWLAPRPAPLSPWKYS